MWKSIALITGVLHFVVGTILFVFYDDVYSLIFTKMMVLKEGSYSFEMWSELVVPMYMSIYVFNCTNHKDVQDNPAIVKPLLKQLGPYVFLEQHKKVDIVFSANHTVSSGLKKTWHFQPDKSDGSLDDVVVTLNAIALSAAEFTRWPKSADEYPFLRVMMNDIFGKTSQELFLVSNVRNLTFDGIDSDLLTMMDNPFLEDLVKIPFDKFGFFYQRNESETYESRIEMWTGEDDIQKIGQITKWKEATNLSEYFPGPCSQLSGSAGEFFPPKREKTSVSIFAGDLCRSIFFNFKEETEVKGVSTYKYWLDEGFLGNATFNSSNECFNPYPDLVSHIDDPPASGQQWPTDEGGEVNLPLFNGLLNVSSCTYDSPSYVSLPHFYNADPALLDQFHPDSDLNPNETEHESYINLMPGAGIPLDVSVRMQINMLARQLPWVSLFDNLKTTVYPMIWFETRTKLTDDMLSQIKLLEFAPKVKYLIIIYSYIMFLTLLMIAKFV